MVHHNSDAPPPPCPACDCGNRFTEAIQGTPLFFCACCAREFTLKGRVVSEQDYRRLIDPEERED